MAGVSVTPAAEELPDIISVDDHVLEPRDLWQRELPASMRDRGPRVSREKVRLEFKGGHYGFVRDADDGQWCDVWLFEDLAMPTGLLHAPAGIPRSEQRNVPAGYEDFRPGTYDKRERLSELDEVREQASSLRTVTANSARTLAERLIPAIEHHRQAAAHFEPPLWVILIAATAISLGTAAGGWRIIKTMGTKVVKLDPVHGFAAETTAASIIFGASHLGMPVSTTHVISSAIMGTGSADKFNAVRWGVARNIGIAWVLTLPAAGLTAALSYVILSPILG